jgi:hypothetical protein
MKQRSKGGVERAAPVIAGAVLLAVAVSAYGCKDLVVETIQPVTQDAGSGVAQVGDPCIPTDEDSAAFPGFDVDEFNLEGQFNACTSGICLVNHFQGRVTCPLGQAAPASCDGDAGCPAASCQTAAASAAENAGKSCCAEGSDVAVSTAVCGQCSARTAADAVYCSCLCGPADGAPADGGPYCACPDSFSCVELVPYLGPGLPSMYSGKYCIKQGTEYTDPTQCGSAVCYE